MGHQEDPAPPDGSVWWGGCASNQGGGRGRGDHGVWAQKNHRGLVRPTTALPPPGCVFLSCLIFPVSKMGIVVLILTSVSSRGVNKAVSAACETVPA